MKYSELTRRYFEVADGAGELCGPDVFRGNAGSRAQGTWVQFDVRVREGLIREARFLAFGCPHTLALAAWIVERAPGSAAAAALPEAVSDLSARFEVPIEKRGRLLVIEDAWLAAMRAAPMHPGAPSPPSR